MTCGTKMRPAGSCYVCEGCGSTSGCSSKLRKYGVGPDRVLGPDPPHVVWLGVLESLAFESC